MHNSNNGQKVALVAVHGVADQSPGRTARSIVELLVSSAPDGVRYAETGSSTLTLQVAPLPPRPPAQERATASPSSAERGFWKSLRQSLKSDIHRAGQDSKAEAPSLRSMTEGTLCVHGLPSDRDIGVAMSDYLLRKHAENGAQAEAFATQQSTLEWHGAQGTSGRVDVFEMYWADLSRLSGQLPRVLTEGATLMFRLCRLGRDTVDLAAAELTHRPDRKQRHVWAWWLNATSQRLLDWVFTHVLSLLLAQLAMLGLLVLALGLMRTYPGHALLAEKGLVGCAAALLLLYGAYRVPTLRWRALVPLGIGVLVVGLLWSRVATAGLALVLLVVLLTLAYDRVLAIADERFPLVQLVGRVMWCAALCVMVVATEAMAPTEWVEPEWNLLMRGTLASFEAVLWVVKRAWIVMALLMVVWLPAGWLAGSEAGHLSRASVATGRLGFAVSAGGFFALVMTLWACFHLPLAAAGGDLLYQPWLFDIGFVTRASELLERRYEASTAAFSAIFVVLIAFVLCVVLAVVPGVLAEVQLLVGRMPGPARHKASPRATDKAGKGAARAARHKADGTLDLGSWLTWWYRHMDTWMRLVVYGAVGVGVLVALTYISWSLPDLLLGAQLTVEHAFRTFSQAWLQPLAFGVTGLTASLVLSGRLLSRALPSLRAPLDVALDIDNHFREFPRTAIPRARIFSRYAALLQHLQAQGYERIVIVAHSQGTVITADLLRFLRTDAVGRLPQQPSAPWLGDGTKALPEIQLLTVGSPLRQLYAARFPFLYRWTIARAGTTSGPAPADIGVRRWLNAFCSGDYVGRWLWAEHAPGTPGDVGHPMDGTVHTPQLGRRSLYASFDPMPPDQAGLAALDRAETCLGVGAHTHYFDTGERAVAGLVHHLVVDPPAQAALHGSGCASQDLPPLWAS
jgi:hypothetical protein